MDIQNTSTLEYQHGKPCKDSKGYYYVTPTGKQKYRDREETYQKRQSPRQKWNSLAFAAAHKQIRQLWEDSAQVEQITQDWKDAMRRGPQGHIYTDAKGWKFAFLQFEWKTANPFEDWYTAYLQEISATAEQKTDSETVSDYMLRRQAELLEAQAAALRAELAARYPATH